MQIYRRVYARFNDVGRQRVLPRVFLCIVARKNFQCAQYVIKTLVSYVWHTPYTRSCEYESQGAKHPLANDSTKYFLPQRNVYSNILYVLFYVGWNLEQCKLFAITIYNNSVALESPQSFRLCKLRVHEGRRRRRSSERAVISPSARVAQKPIGERLFLGYIAVGCTV